VLEQVYELLSAKGVMLALRDRLTGETVIQACKGEWERITGQRLPSGAGITGRVIETGKVYLTHDIRSDPLFMLPEFAETIQAVGCAPLIVQGQSIGAIMVGVEQPLTSNDMRILSAIADMVGSAIHRAELLEQTRSQAAELTQAYDATIEGWARAMEMRDKETQGHTRRVTQMTIRLAQTLGVIGSDLEKMRRGVLLHDIGKMGVPDTILLKPGPLNKEEWEIMHQHPQYAFEMLHLIPYLRGSLDIPYSHHEHWDGSGYPRESKCEEIPLPARIFAVVDVWDALTSDRPYRKAWSREDTRTYLQEQANILFDPKVVESFLTLVDGGEI
jgi:putative nucleotidyltransferase with HDIG domain